MECVQLTPTVLMITLWLMNRTTILVVRVLSFSASELSIEILFWLACGLTCDPGFTLNSDTCSCVLTDVCMTQPSPCNNGGNCTLNSAPDNFTCDCTGTGFTGVNCTGTVVLVI